MKQTTPTSNEHLFTFTQRLPGIPLRFNAVCRSVFTSLILMCMAMPVFSQTGTWTALTNSPVNGNDGVMLLLADGRVLCKNNTGVGWDILSPDGSGSYANGGWTSADDMDSSRTFCTSQVLQDGRVFIAGGEYGSGGNEGATYNPLINLWSSELDFGQFISDAVSEILADGSVMFSPVNGDRRNTIIWSPDNTWMMGPRTNRGTNEATWIKLADNSILTVPTNSTLSERFIPALNQWQNDGTVPAGLYSPVGSETGGACLLPDGRAFFIGGNNNTAYYTPTGDNTAGTWAAGPALPDDLTAPDAAAAMLRNGHILMALSPVMFCCDTAGKNVFPSPTSFYEFDYTSETYTQVNAPGGGLTINAPSFVGTMVNLPNGQILWGRRGQTQYYVYTPGSAQLAANRPQIDDIIQHNDGTFTLIGKRLNGWSEGSSYGDDWQMNSNYPIVRLTDGGSVYYARTYNWSCVGCVRTGNETVTTEFELPAGLPAGTYDLRVIANGIQSDPVAFCTPHIDVSLAVTSDISCHGDCDGAILATPVGATLPTYQWSNAETTNSIDDLCGGTYTVTVTNLLGLGCDIVRSIDLPDPDLLTASAMATTNYNGYNVSCNGGSDGAATANGSGGTTPYSFHWDIPSDDQSPSGLMAGTYHVTVTDDHGCTATASVTLTEPTPLTIEAGPNQTVYYGYPPAECATIDWSGEGGGVPPYTIEWSDGGGQSHEVCPGLYTTVYTVSITDQNNCVATDSVIICVIDVRCGNNLNKVELCHVPPDNPSNPGTLCVALSAVADHLSHGDMLAACGTDHSCPPEVPALAATPISGTSTVHKVNPDGLIYPASIGEEHPVQETSLKVYPNPAKGSATIAFTTKISGWVTLRLFNQLGQQVSILFDGEVQQGVMHRLLMDGNGMSSGMYVCTLQIADEITTSTLILNP
jgi:hypothetical protein